MKLKTKVLKRIDLNFDLQRICFSVIKPFFELCEYHPSLSFPLDLRIYPMTQTLLFCVADMVLNLPIKKFAQVYYLEYLDLTI